MTARRRRRLGRALLGTVAALGAVFVLAVVAVVSVFLNPRWSTLTARWALSRIELYPGAELRVEFVNLGTDGTVAIAGATLVEDDTLVVASLPRATLRVQPRPLLQRTVRIDSLHLFDPVVDLDRVLAGRAARPKQERPADPTKRAVDFGTGPIRVDGGRLVVPLGQPGGPRRLDLHDIDLRAHGLRSSPAFEVHLDALAARVSAPGSPRVGTLAARGRVVGGHATLDSLRLHTAASHLTLRAEAPVGTGLDSLLANLDLDLDANPIDATDLASFVAVPPAGGTAVVVVRVRLRGPVPRRTTGTATIDVTAARWGNRRLLPARFATRWSEGDVEIDAHGGDDRRTVAVTGQLRPFDTPMPFAFDIASFAGRAELRGDIAWNDGPRYRITRGRAVGLDLSPFVRGAPPTDLDAEVAIEGRGFSPRTLSASVTLDTGHASVGRFAVDALHVQAQLDSGAAHVQGDARARGGAMTLDARLQPFAAPVAIEAARAGFTHIDLAAWVNGAPPSDLSGSLVVEAQTMDRRARHVGGRVTLGPSRCGEQPIAGADLRVAMAGDDVRVEGDVRFPDGGVTLAATARPFGAAPRYAVQGMRFTRLDPGALLARPPLRMQLTGRVAGHAAGRRLDDLVAQVHVELDPSSRGRLRVEALRADASVDRGAVHTIGTLHVPGGNGDFAVEGLLRGDATEYRADLTLRVDDATTLVGRDSSSAGANLTLHAEGHGLRREHLSLHARVAGDGVWRDVLVDTLALALHVGGDTLRLDALHVRSNVAWLDGGGSLHLADRLPVPDDSLFVRGVVLDAAPLAPLIGRRSLGLEAGALAAVLRRDAEGAALVATVRGRNARLDAVAAEAVSVDVRGQLTDGLRPRRMVASVRADMLHSGRHSVPRVVVGADLDTTQVRLRIATLANDGTTMVAAGFATRGRTGTGVLDTLAVDLAGDAWRLEHPVRFAYGRRIEIDDLRLSAGARHLHIDGAIDRDGPNGLDVEIVGLQLDPLAPVFGFPHLQGDLAGTVRIEGAGAEARLRGTLAVQLEQAKHATAAGVRFAQDHRGLDVMAWIQGTHGDSLTVAGQLPPLVPGPFAPSPRPVLSTAPIELRLRADDFAIDPVKVVLPGSAVRELKGRLTTDLQIRGTLVKPLLEGDIAIVDGVVDVAAIGTPYHDLRLRATIAGDKLHVEELVARSGRGRIVAHGDLGGVAAGGAVALTVELDRFRALHARGLRLQASGALRLTGTVTAPIVNGNVVLTDSDIDVSAQSSNVVGAVQLTEADWKMLEEHFGLRARREAKTPLAFFDTATLAVNLTAGRDTWLRRRANPRLSVELKGTVDVRKEPNGPVLVYGRLEAQPDRSRLEQFGRRLGIEKGTVVVNGDPAKAQMDLIAEYQATSADNPKDAQVLVRVAVKGGVDDFRLELSSEPPMGQTDIMTALLTGRAPSGAGAAGGVADDGNAGAELAVGQASLLVEQFGSELGLDVLQITPDGVRGATLVAGRYVSSETYVGLRQSATFEQERATTSATGARTEVEIEHELLEWLLINLQGGVSDVRVLLRSRYAY